MIEWIKEINWKRMTREVWQTVVGVLVVSAVIFILQRLFMGAIPPENKDAVMLVIGNVLTWGGIVVGYWFGSSKGSADKSDKSEQT